MAPNLDVDASHSCCGVKEITGIREFDEPVQVLKSFLENEGRYAMFSSLYLFTGVEQFEEGLESIDRPEKEDSQDDDDYQYELDLWREENFSGYGSRLAAYIRKYGLGRVWTTGQIENRHQHPGRMIQAWLWSPNEEKLLAWGKKRGVNR
jgi:hypothetical protein